MTRETLKKLYIRLNGLREQRKKEKFILQRQGELIRVAQVLSRDKYGLTRCMQPTELLRWLEGCVYGFNSCWYNTTET